MCFLCRLFFRRFVNTFGGDVDDPDFDVVFQNDVSGGRRALCRQLLHHPQQAKLWGYLVQYLLTHGTVITDTVVTCCRTALHHDSKHQDQVDVG